MTDPNSEIVENAGNPDLKELYRKATEARPMLQAKADELLETLRAAHPGAFDNVTFEMADLKDIEKTQQKIAVRYNGDETKITDILRGRFITENAGQIELIEAALKQDGDIANVVNKFKTPVNNTGYRGMSSEIRLPNGHVAELQTVHKDMLRIDNYMHTQMDRIRELHYEATQEGRKLTTPEKKEVRAIEKEMREVSRAAAHDSADPRLNELIEPDIRSRHTYSGDTVNGSALESVLENIETKNATVFTAEASPTIRAKLDSLNELKTAIHGDSAKTAANSADIADAAKQFTYIEQIDLKVHVVADAATGERFMVKVDVPEHEITDLRKASELVFPEHLQDVIDIPKLVTDDKGLMPPELRNAQGNIMVMEIAQGEELKPYQYGFDGKKPGDLQIKSSDWEKFEEAIQYMNDNGVVHKDLKNTENIFVSVDASGNTRFELIDWGGPINNIPTSDLQDLERVSNGLKSAGIVQPPSHIDDLKSVLQIGIQDGINIEANSDGRLTIEPISGDANKYEIQLDFENQSGAMRVTKPNGEADIIKLDQEQLVKINDMMSDIEVPGAESGRLPNLEDTARLYQEANPPKINVESPEFRLNGEFNGKAGDILPDAPQVGALDNAADALKQTDTAADIADGIRAANTATDALKAGKAVSKTAKLSIIGGVALTGGVAALLHYAHSSQRDLAEKLNENGQLSDEAYQEYVELNQKIEAEMQTENLAGQGWFFLVTTPAVEASARAQFSEFSAKHKLSPELHDALGMSMFNGESLAGKFSKEAIDMIPDKMSEVDPEFHDLWRATRELEDAQIAYNSAHAPPMHHYGMGGMPYAGAYDPDRPQRQAETKDDLAEAKLAHQQEFARLLADPETGDKLLSMMPQDVLLDMVKETTRYHANGQHALIDDIAALQQRIDADDTGWIDEWKLSGKVDDALEKLAERPEILHAYIRDVFGDNSMSTSQPTAEASNTVALENVLNEMPDFMQHRTLKGVAETINNTENTDGIHPYLTDLANLYKRADNQYIHSSARERYMNKIEELETEIMKNPQIVAEYLQNTPEAQSVVKDYLDKKEEINTFANVSDQEFTQAFTHIKQNALAGENVNNENAMVKELSELYIERENSSWYEWIDKPDLDTKIELMEDKLHQNPEIISEYMKNHTGNDLISQASLDNDTLNNGIETQYAQTDTSFTEEIEYIEVASAMERISSGEPLDAYEEQAIEEILNNADTDPAILAALQEQYGENLNQFISTQPETPENTIDPLVAQNNNNNTIAMRI